MQSRASLVLVLAAALCETASAWARLPARAPAHVSARTALAPHGLPRRGGTRAAAPPEPDLSPMDAIKEAGVAGVLSYFVVELTFFAIALPIGYYWWHYSTGEWLQPLLLLERGDGAERLQLLGLVASYIFVLKAALPVRLGSTLLLMPYTRRLLDGAGLGGPGVG